MALGRRKALVVPEIPQGDERSMIASAARITVAEATFPLLRWTDESWQREAWGFYETNGELSYTADYIGAAISLVRLTINHVDERGVMQGEVKDDPEIEALAHTMLGGPAVRAGVLRALSVGLTVAGSTYLIGRSNPILGDSWTVVANQYVRPTAGKVQVDFGNGEWVTLNPARDTVMRIWRQSPQRPLLATSPARALLLTFAQLQKLRMFMSSELNSRIASGGGLYPLPMELQFPGDADAGIPPGAPGVAQMVWQSAASNIEGYGTAAAIAPTFFEAPIEIIEKMMKEPIRFDVPLSDHAMDYRKELIADVARGMNVPSDVVEGMSNANHWQAWWATEEFATKTVAPDMTLLVNALTNSWLKGELLARKKDPNRYMVWFDLAPLNNTADKFTDTLNLYREGAVSLETLLASANYNMSNAPKQKEFIQRKLWVLAERDPTLLQIEGFRKFLDIDIPDFTPALAAPDIGNLEEPGAPPPPAPARTPEDRAVGSKPSTPLRDDLNASGLVEHPAVVPVANAVVLAALAVAGRRLCTAKFKGLVDKDFPPVLMHTRIKVASLEHADELLASAWSTAGQSLAGVTDADRILPQLHEYARGLLASGIPHSPELLSAFLAGK
jgi:hypothetical protein